MLPQQMNLASLALLKYSLSKFIMVLYNLGKKNAGDFGLYFSWKLNTFLYVRFHECIFCLLSCPNVV